MNRGGGTHEYPRGSSGEMEVRSRLADERDRKRGRGKYDLRTSAEKKAANRRNLLNVALFAFPAGLAFRGIKALHYGATMGKGARPLVFMIRGKQSVRFYDPRRGFISAKEYHRRQGLRPVTYGKETYRAAVDKIHRTFPKTTSAVSRAEKASSIVRDGPVEYLRKRLLNRIIPRPVQWAIGAGIAYDNAKDLVGELLSEEETGSYRRYRTPLVFDKAGSTDRSNQRRPVRWVYNRQQKKNQPRCPSGFRYDPRSNSCVRVGK